MPSSAIILAGLSEIAHRFRLAAIGWHVVLGAMLVAIVMGWRPSSRAVARLQAALFASVAILAWLTRNAFNGLVFSAITAGALALAAPRQATAMRPAPAWRRWAGIVAILFGWCYPHFVEARNPLTFLYAAPTGLLPCPTLSLVIGSTLLVEGSFSRSWSALLSIVGMFYAAFGVFRLGVTIDAFLGLASVLLLCTASRHAVEHISLRGDLPAKPRSG